MVVDFIPRPTAQAHNRMTRNEKGLVLVVGGKPHIGRLQTVENPINMQGSRSKVGLEPGSTEVKGRDGKHCGAVT